MIETDVLVVGSGPAGGTAALALSTLGIANVLITRYGWLADSPRAHITNQRTMEVLRDLGVEPEVIARGTPQALMGNNVFCTSLAGDELGRLLTWGTHPARQADYTLASPTSMCDVPQTLMEPILVGTAAARGSKVRFDTEYLSLAQDAEGVTATVRDRLRGDTYQIRAKYLIGADGGRSKVAEDLDLPFEGKMGVAGSMNIVFEADLSRYVAHRPSVLYWVMQPGSDVGGIGMGLVRMVRPWNEWLIVWGYDINQPAPTVTDAMATEIAHKLIGDDSIPVKIRSSSVWTVNDQYARSNTRGRVTGTRPATAWARTPRFKTPTTWPGSSRWCCGARRSRRCWPATTPSARPSRSRSSPAPTSRSASSGPSSRRWGCCRPPTRWR
jgi:2,4-dichlorophenol 6-monooxygenase